MSHAFSESLAGGTYSVGKPGLTAGTTTTYTTGAAFTAIIEGQAYTKAAVTNGTTPTTDGNSGLAFTAVPVGSACNFVFGVNSGGTVSVYQGKAVPVGEPADYPSLPFSVAVFGTVRVSVGATGAAWTMGASNLAGPPTGVTFTFADRPGLPARPTT
jgi:hypothetical protein